MTITAMRQQRDEILKEIAGLEQIRRGTVTEQHVQTVGPDGSKRTRGPYPLYTFKDRGKTVSRRLSDQEQIPMYREQIQHWRRFHELVEQLRVLGEKLSDLAVEQRAEKKTPNTKSKRHSKSPTSSNG
jgi:hypothetical protein